MKGSLLQEVCDTFSEEENVQIKERSQELRQHYLTLLQAMGGDLKLIVEFPDRLPVALAGFGEIASSKTR